MTRVEKYRLYRKEILNSFYTDDKETSKKKSAEFVSKKTLNRDVSKMSYDDVLEAYKIYDDGTEVVQKEQKRLNEYQKRHIIFVSVCIGLITLLLTGLILVGIKLFGG